LAQAKIFVDQTEAVALGSVGSFGFLFLHHEDFRRESGSAGCRFSARL